MNRHCPFPRLVASLAALPMVAAGETAPDKSRYHLFNPVPRDQMRDLSADRPDRTESAYTVDAGHFQAEMDLVNYTLDRSPSDHSFTRFTAWNIAPINLKAGLCNRADVQLVFDSYVEEMTEDLATGVEERNRGVGDLKARFKFNLWGNDQGRTAMALMPFVKFPTASSGLGNGSVEGGLILPLAVALSERWTFAGMAEVDVNRDATGDGHHAEYGGTVELAGDLVGRLGGYLEFFAMASTEPDAEWVGTVDVGFTFGVTKDFQVDAGVNIGVTRAADDFQPFIGLTYRY
jgi:hypothetical protein